MFEYLYEKKSGSKIARSNRKEGDRVGAPLRLFSSQTFSHINTPTFLKPSHSSHLRTYEDGTDRVFRNVGV